MSALPHLQKQLRELQKSPPAGFRVEAESNLYQWTIWFTGPQDTPYAGGQYKAMMTFTKEFPMEPPTFRVVSEFWHPNVYPDGRVCISILHPPGVDEMNAEETAMMRWTPVQTVRSVLISVISLLSDPDPKDAGAPANVDALRMYRTDQKLYNTKCEQLAQKSLAELPEDFVPPVMHEKVDLPQQSLFSYGAAAAADSDDDDDFDFSRPSPGAATSKTYTEELAQIRGMGVGGDKSDEFILNLLQESRGDLATAMEKLF